MKKYVCVVCGFEYDEAIGMPNDGIPAGTKWDDVPNDWECPDCSVGKSEFEMQEI
jgi:rubredoxin